MSCGLWSDGSDAGTGRVPADFATSTIAESSRARQRTGSGPRPRWQGRWY